MRILHTVESYLPARHGMSEFVRQVSERLAAKGHEVIVATSHDSRRKESRIAGVNVRGFNLRGKSAVGIWGDISGYQQFLMDLNPDVITNFAAQQWATDLVFPLLPFLKAKKVLVPNGFSALGDEMFRDYFAAMRNLFSLYDACIFCSDEYRDIQFARECGVQNNAFIAVGAASEDYDVKRDTGFRARLGIPESDFLVLHMAGYLSQAKGQLEAVRIFSNSKLKDATLLLSSPGFAESPLTSLKPREILKGFYHLLRGNGFRGFTFSAQLRGAIRWKNRANQKVGRSIFTSSLSQEDKIQAFLNADLFLFPSWIECSPLVLYESIASGTPFLVTDVGNSAEIIRWTGGGRLLHGTRRKDREGSVVADVVKGAELLTDVWKDEGGRRRMASCGQQAWRQHFQWETITDRYEELYLALVRGEDIRGRFLPPPPAIA